MEHVGLWLLLLQEVSDLQSEEKLQWAATCLNSLIMTWHSLQEERWLSD